MDKYLGIKITLERIEQTSASYHLTWSWSFAKSTCSVKCWF